MDTGSIIEVLNGMSFGSLAFTPVVKMLQERHGSRRQYEQLECSGRSHDRLGTVEKEFLAGRDSFYWATTGSTGWPYVQHHVLEGEPAHDWIERVRVPGYKAVIERVFVVHVEAFDWNCPQHITPRYTAEEIQDVVRPLEERLQILERENAALRKGA